MRMTQEKKEKNEIVVLGAPPRKEEDEDSMELPDIPDTPQSPTVSDITVLRLVLFYIGIILSFLDYEVFFLMVTFYFFYFLARRVPPTTGVSHLRCIQVTALMSCLKTSTRIRLRERGPYSNTPPPPCDRPDHDLCVPPAWGERIPGSPVLCRCVLCHEDSCIQAVRCIQCLNAPRCCS